MEQSQLAIAHFRFYFFSRGLVAKWLSVASEKLVHSSFKKLFQRTNIKQFIKMMTKSLKKPFLAVRGLSVGHESDLVQGATTQIRDMRCDLINTVLADRRHFN